MELRTCRRRAYAYGTRLRRGAAGARACVFARAGVCRRRERRAAGVLELLSRLLRRRRRRPRPLCTLRSRLPERERVLDLSRSPAAGRRRRPRSDFLSRTLTVSLALSLSLSRSLSRSLTVPLVRTTVRGRCIRACRFTHSSRIINSNGPRARARRTRISRGRGTRLSLRSPRARVAPVAATVLSSLTYYRRFCIRR